MPTVKIHTYSPGEGWRKHVLVVPKKWARLVQKQARASRHQDAHNTKLAKELHKKELHRRPRKLIHLIKKADVSIWYINAYRRRR